MMQRPPGQPASPIDYSGAQGLFGTPGGVISQAPQPGAPTQPMQLGNPMGWGGGAPPQIYGQPGGGYQGQPQGGMSPEMMAQLVAWLRANGGMAGGGMGGIG